MSLVVPNDFKKKEAREIIEKKRHKGKALINRKEKEKTIYISKVLWPIRYFELNYEVPRIFFPKKTRKISKKLFMLGFFSHSVVKETLRRKNGKKALKLIFSRAKRHILNSLKKYRSITPKLPIYDPNTIFRELTACYITKVEELEKNIDVTKQRIKPFLQNAEELEKKATELQKKIQSLNSRNTHDKKNLKKEMIAQKRSLKKKAKTIRKKARKELKPLERNLKRYKNKWKRGKKRFLKLKSNAKNITFKIINSYFYLYWIARLENSSRARYLILNEHGREVKKLQRMLLNDAEMRSHLEAQFSFITKKSITTCYYCGKPIEKTMKICPHCQKEILTCAVCKLPLSKYERIGKCPKCEAMAHLSHLFEWIKTNGTCPRCLQNLLPESIIEVKNEKNYKEI